MKNIAPTNNKINSNLLLKILCHDLGNSVLLTQAVISKWDKNYATKNQEHDDLWKKIKKINITQRKIINYVRALSSFIDNKDIISLEEITLKSIVSQCKDLLSEKVLEKKISIIEKYDESTNFTVEKNTFCNHVMMNLLSNAIKFSEENGEICIDVKNHPKEVELIVKDNGIGMLEEDIVKALKGDKINSRKGTKGELGTGWGLRITSIFLGFYGARLDISNNHTLNKNEQGTTFHIYFKK